MAESILRADIRRTYVLARGNTLKRLLLCAGTPGVHAVVTYRFGQWVLRRNVVLRVLLDPIFHALDLYVKVFWGIEISRRAQIGAGLYVGHFGGITVSPLAVIGRNCNISQQVTIGISGQGERRGVPRMGDNIYIAPGARLFGKITIGNNVRIGANCVVYKDVPDNCFVVLDPGFKIIPRTNVPAEPSTDDATAED